MDVQSALRTVVSGGELSRAEMRALVLDLLERDFDPLHVAAFLSAIATRGETTAEIAGGAIALRERMIVFEHAHPDAIDTCGTGGDGLDSFNVSTAAAIVAAGAGAKVVKHGNRSQSGRCGSADLVEAAGIPLALSADAARASLDEVGITFLFAPNWHPLVARVAPIRRALGVRTLFNFLGPLCNPGRVRRQVLGVPHRARVEPMARALTDLGHVSAFVVHGAGGADELSLAGANVAHGVGAAPLVRFDAVELGLASAPCSALRGGDARENLRLLQAILSGERGPLRDAVLLNAAAALIVAGCATSAAEGLAAARESIDRGAARATLSNWIALTRKLGSTV